MQRREIKFREDKAKTVEEAFLRAIEIVERIKLSGISEYKGLFTGLSGGYVSPGASGALTRGKIEILPTGRNFYAVDPTTIPTPYAWKVGVETAEKLIKYYLEKHGRYPESVGQVLWSIDAYKADGEQLAQILYLLGVKPIWRPDGSVGGLEVIPLDELKRPRIDVVVRISGIVRDTLPNYVYLIDEAVSKVANMDEPLELNYVRKHYIEHLSKLIEMGINKDEAKEMALYRVYGDPPGAYGAGVDYAVEASAWKNDMDLAKVWIQWSSYAYTKKGYGKQATEALVLSLTTVDVVNKNHISDEHDILNDDGYYSYHGGFYNAVKALTKRNDIEIVTVDTRDISATKVRGMKEEIERVVRAKVLNPAWINEMKKHGYRGASELLKKIHYLYGWSATTKLVDGWIFDEIANTYVLNEEMRRWFEENNVWALEELTRRLIEAAERGLWNPSEEMKQKLKEVYGEIEGILEESIGEGDVQGGAIQIYTADDDEHWKENIAFVEEAINKLEKLKRSGA